MENHQIKCCVSDCKHNANAQYCCLTSINVGNNMCSSAMPDSCESTECDSYECRD
jgi:hypothetical protein